MLEELCKKKILANFFVKFQIRFCPVETAYLTYLRNWWSRKIKYLKFNSNLPGANELKLIYVYKIGPWRYDLVLVSIASTYALVL